LFWEVRTDGISDGFQQKRAGPETRIPEKDRDEPEGFKPPQNEPEDHP